MKIVAFHQIAGAKAKREDRGLTIETLRLSIPREKPKLKSVGERSLYARPNILRNSFSRARAYDLAVLSLNEIHKILME